MHVEVCSRMYYLNDLYIHIFMKHTTVVSCKSPCSIFETYTKNTDTNIVPAISNAEYPLFLQLWNYLLQFYEDRANKVVFSGRRLSIAN